MSNHEDQKSDTGLSRRKFILSAAAAGAGMLLTQPVFSQAPAPVVSPAAGATPAAAPASQAFDLNIAFIGLGWQGSNLIQCCLKIPGLKIKAICDIWPYRQTYYTNVLKKYKHEVKAYTNYQEMLANEKDLQAVVIATPDFMHAEHTNACLKAGLHVYCEKEMSNTLEAAASMVRTSRETGKFLQIGHQRRSNPRYQHCLKMIYGDKILGQITNIQGQWNKGISAGEIPVPNKPEMLIDKAILNKYGYEDMKQFLNWRWYKKYSGGPISDIGSHQIDVFSWFLKANPTAVVASGGQDYFKDREWYDNIITIFEYNLEQGSVRGVYQQLNTTSFGIPSQRYEVFMGTEGTLIISEDEKVGNVIKESNAKTRQWEEQSTKDDSGSIQLKVGETPNPTAEGIKAKESLTKGYLQPHLENFFEAVVAGKPEILNCPGEVGYETAAAVLRINDTVAAQQRYVYNPEEFKVV